MLQMQNSTAIGTATIFISHAWECNFLDTISALEIHFKDAPDTIIWFDLFSYNQHHKATSLPYEWWSTAVKSAIAQFGHTVMVMAPWNNPIPYTRAWCIFQAYCTAATGSKFEIALSATEQKQFFQDIKSDPERSINAMLAEVNAEKSECGKPEDRTKIFRAIESSVGFVKINAMLFEQYHVWFLEMGNQNLEKQKEVFGPFHPNTLTSMNNLAVLYESQGKYDDAEPLFMECLEKTKRALGPDHPDTLASMNNLARLYESQGKYDDAEPLYVECFEKAKRARGPDHPNTLASMNNLAALYRCQGKYDDAEPLCVECLEKKKTPLGGPDHPSTLASMNNLAGLYKSQGKYDDAEPLHVE